MTAHRDFLVLGALGPTATPVSICKKTMCAANREHRQKSSDVTTLTKNLMPR